MEEKSSWTSDDITFCGSECDCKSCFRHPSNIHYPWMPHSFADLKTQYIVRKMKQSIISGKIKRRILRGVRNGKYVECI